MGGVPRPVASQQEGHGFVSPLGALSGAQEGHGFDSPSGHCPVLRWVRLQGVVEFACPPRAGEGFPSAENLDNDTQEEGVTC